MAIYPWIREHGEMCWNHKQSRWRWSRHGRGSAGLGGVRISCGAPSHCALAVVIWGCDLRIVSTVHRQVLPLVPYWPRILHPFCHRSAGEFTLCLGTSILFVGGWHCLDHPTNNKSIRTIVVTHNCKPTNYRVPSQLLRGTDPPSRVFPSSKSQHLWPIYDRRCCRLLVKLQTSRPWYLARERLDLCQRHSRSI